MAGFTQLKTGNWRATVKAKGFQKSKTFINKKDAKLWAVQLEASLLKNPSQSQPDYTVSDLIEEYKQLRKDGKREVEDKSHTYYLIQKLEKAFGSRKATTLTVQDYRQYVSKRLKESDCQNALGNELSLLKTIYKRASAVLNLEIPNQLDKALTLLTEMNIIKTASKERDRRIIGDELDRIKEKLSTAQLRDIVDIAVALGLRRNEILGLQWKELDEKNKMIWVRDRKHPREKKGNDTHMPLVFRTLKILQRQPKTSEFIFPDLRGENVSDNFLKACRKCGIENLHFHDLRHEAISRLFEAGLKIQEVAMISGHIDWRHLRRYTNLKPKDIHTTLDKLLKDD